MRTACQKKTKVIGNHCFPFLPLIKSFNWAVKWSPGCHSKPLSEKKIWNERRKSIMRMLSDSSLFFVYYRTTDRARIHEQGIVIFVKARAYWSDIGMGCWLNAHVHTDGTQIGDKHTYLNRITCDITVKTEKSRGHMTHIFVKESK